jgi:hypothetical protein
MAGPRARTQTLAPGFAAGVLGGIVMAAAMVVAATLDGLEPLEPLRPLGDTFAGGEARDGGWPLLVYGIALHLLFAGVVGVLLAVLLPRDLEPRFASVMCIGYALGVMAVMTSYVLPAFNASLSYEMPVQGGAWVLAHAAYGLAAGFLIQVFRRRSRVPEARRIEGLRRAPAQERRPVAASR